ncbi:MAG: lamin tail domain-containing protein, partial [Patescibacteria group bacterium]
MLRNPMKNEQIKKKGGRSAKPTALLLIYSVLFFTPIFLLAQIEITEIMYDLEGDDDGSDNKQRREWIEIYNSGDGIDLSDWKLYEAETNHGIDSVLEGGSVFLLANSYAVIVDKPEVFKAEHPNFSGVIFDSAFNLSNTGETLIIRNSNLDDINEVTYSSEQGANGNGNSLQKISEGNWGACSPTPGAPTASDCLLPIGGIVVVENFSEEEPPETSQTQLEKPVLTSTTPVSATTYKTEPQIFASIIPLVDTPIAGADFFFEAEAFGLKNEPLLNAKYQWSFGDGAKAEGQKVLHNYQYPSNYLAILEVISGEYSVS